MTEEEEQPLADAEQDQLLAEWPDAQPPAGFAARITAKAIRPRRQNRALLAVASTIAIAAVLVAVIFYRQANRESRERAKLAAELAEYQRINEEERSEAAKISADIVAIMAQIANANESDRAKLAARLKAKEEERKRNAVAAENARSRLKQGWGIPTRQRGAAGRALNLDVDSNSTSSSGVKGQ